MKQTRARRAWAAAVVGLLVVAGAACSSSDNGAAGPTQQTTAGPTTGATTPVPAGLPAFYGVPDPLPPGEPGDVIAQQQVDVDGVDGTVWRVMYHSRSIAGDDIAVTGLVIVPDGPAPADGWPVVTWAHGTVGVADICAPSVDVASIAPLANPLLDAGYLITATDYEGMGTPGIHPYIAGESEGRGVLDIVLAARIMDVDASDRFLVWGHSQGGHAAMFAGHMAAEVVPDLTLVGVVAGAPPSQLLLINAALQSSPYKYYIAMAAVGLNAAYGDQRAPLDQVLTPEGLDFLDTVETTCAAGLRTAAAGIDFSAVQKADPATIPTWNELLRENDPGTFTAPIPVPLLIIQGGADEQIPVASTQLLFGQLCAIGQVEQRWVYPDQSHAGVVAVSLDDMLAWIGNRFAGDPAPDPYQPVGPPAPETQSCPSG